MKKILVSIATIALIGGAVTGITGAFYGDTERSTGNTFVAGSVELRVDSTSHYNHMVCTDQGWQPDGTGDPVGFPVQGSDCDGSWAETDLEEGVHKFFNFLDLKPGDWGEDTISLHVYDNDAWGQFVVENVVDRDNTCTEPEVAVEGDGCVDPDGDGELDNHLRITAWLDQGLIPGFQNIGPDGQPVQTNPLVDPEEGDNIYQVQEGPYIWQDELISNLGPFALRDVLIPAYDFGLCNQTDGANDYGPCQGLAQDGRMVGSTTYYFGLAWHLDLFETGNDVQTDEYIADLTFRVEQHRNNPNPFQPQP